MFDLIQVIHITGIIPALIKRHTYTVEEDGVIYTHLPTHVEIECGKGCRITYSWIEGDYTDQNPCNITLNNTEYAWVDRPWHCGYAVLEAEGDGVEEAPF